MQSSVTSLAYFLSTMSSLVPLPFNRRLQPRQKTTSVSVSVKDIFFGISRNEGEGEFGVVHLHLHPQ
jgi:allophanate hydrolase subunit 1